MIQGDGECGRVETGRGRVCRVEVGAGRGCGLLIRHGDKSAGSPPQGAAFGNPRVPQGEF